MSESSDNCADVEFAAAHADGLGNITRWLAEALEAINDEMRRLACAAAGVAYPTLSPQIRATSALVYQAMYGMGTTIDQARVDLAQVRVNLLGPASSVSTEPFRFGDVDV